MALGHAPREQGSADVDAGAPDTVVAHPVYASAAWLAVVNPGTRTTQLTRELLRTAYAIARSRYERKPDAVRRHI